MLCRLLLHRLFVGLLDVLPALAELLQGIKLALQVKPTGLLVSGDRLWYGADIALETTKGPAPGPKK